MISAGTLQAANQARPFGHILLARAFWVLVFFTLLFLVAFPRIDRESPYSKPNLTPALVVLVLGAATWVSMLAVCVRAFRRAAPRPSVLSSAAFFLFFGCELLFAAFALRQL